MDIWETDKLIIFLLFVIPGFISLKTYELFIPNEQKDSSKQIIDAVAYSCMNYAILLMPIIYIESNSIKDTSPMLYYIFYLVVFFIAPIIWMIIWTWLRTKDMFQKLAPHPIIKPWDYVFSKRKSYWIKITLINGTVVGGKYSNNSFASNSPAKQQIYLEESWIINDNGGFDRIKNDTEGIMIMENRISYIEFRKFKRN